MVQRIKRIADKPDGLLSWDAAKIVDNEGGVIDYSALADVRLWIDWASREAELPLLFNQRAVNEAGKGIGEVAQGMCVESIEAALELAVGVPIKLAKIAGGILAPEAVQKAETAIETRSRQAKSVFRQASFDFGPLLPAGL